MKQLWAPWRLEYIKSADEEPGCIFCAAVEGDDEEKLVVSRSEHAFVLLNRFPYASGHFMAAPIRHVAEFSDLDDTELVEIHRLASSGMGGLSHLYSRRRTTSAGTSAASRAQASSTTCICTSSRAGPATRTSCRSSQT